MGTYLEKPATKKQVTNSVLNRIRLASVAMQGWRQNMEDAHLETTIMLPPVDPPKKEKQEVPQPSKTQLKLNQKECEDQKAKAEKPKSTKAVLLGVFDGHGHQGDAVAVFARDNLPPLFERHLKAAMEEKGKESLATDDVSSAFKRAFLELDRDLSHLDYCYQTGSTACVVLISNDFIWCTNLGDSRAVLWNKDGETVPLSEDHKPDDDAELRRIETAGHFVEDSRVDSNLALSRAFGDYIFKDQPEMKQEQQAVCAMPDVKVIERNPEKESLMLVACDGIWECLLNEEIGQYLRENHSKNRKAPLSKAVETLFDDIISPSPAETTIGTDNMSAILAAFPVQAPPKVVKPPPSRGVPSRFVKRAPAKQPIAKLK